MPAWCSPRSPKAPIKHIEFVSLAPDRALVVLVTADGHVENRVFVPPIGLTPSAMSAAANFLNAILHGRTLGEMHTVITAEIAKNRAELDELSQQLIEHGVAVWAPVTGAATGSGLIVRGRAYLLAGTEDATQLERMRGLFDDLERKRDLAQLLELSEEGDGVRVFIGARRTSFFHFPVHLWSSPPI